MSSKFVFVCLFLVTNYLYVASTDLDIVDTTPEEFPYLGMVIVNVMRRPPCPAALITESYLVTPALCVHGGTWSGVYFGNNVKEVYTQINNSTHIIIHEDAEYRNKSYHYINNIALLKLEQPVNLTDQVRPGKLISIDPNTLNEELLAQLICRRYDNGGSTSVMQAKTVQILNQTTCKSYFESLFLNDQELCALSGSQDYLNDYANVLTVNKKIAGFQVERYDCQNNTIDTSLKCSQTHVFLNIAPFIPWISEKVGVSVEKLTASN